MKVVKVVRQISAEQAMAADVIINDMINQAQERAAREGGVLTHTTVKIVVEQEFSNVN